MSEGMIVLCIFAAMTIWSWLVVRHYCIVLNHKPVVALVIGVFIPLINVILAVGLWDEMVEKIPEKRSPAEFFFGIKKEHYWKD